MEKIAPEIEHKEIDADGSLRAMITVMDETWCVAHIDAHPDPYGRPRWDVTSDTECSRSMYSLTYRCYGQALADYYRRVARFLDYRYPSFYSRG